MMSTESLFSRVLPSRNLLIALEQIDPPKFCKKYGITHTIGNHKIHQTKLLVFMALVRAHFKIFYLSGKVERFEKLSEKGSENVECNMESFDHRCLTMLATIRSQLYARNATILFHENKQFCLMYLMIANGMSNTSQWYE